MLTTVLDTAHLPPADRLAAWVETTGQALVRTQIRFHAPGGRASIQTMALGPAELSVLSYTPLSSRRTSRLIRQSDPEQYQLALVTGGRQSIEQARQYAPLNAGDLVVYDSSRPFHAAVEPSSCGASRSVLLQFPRHLLPLPDTVVAPLCGTRLSGRASVGRLLGQLLTGLVETHADLTPADCIRVGNTAIDLTAALLAHHADRQTLLPAGSRQRVLFERINAYITTHLHDPGLTPGAIAAAHFISTRYLHRIFQQHHSTVSDVIRQQRLDRCRRDLADPAQHTVPIAAIAMRWGYPRASDFTRAFRSAVGMAPSEYRAASQGANRA
ncbi:AraC family transcriptional regulator [Streptomyces fodineus]|uniref:AraC family transcriptional regulator n=1 Tax=Streptomyces fodineus TaxID=1904616 RepID=A0A1D7Y2X1_9ACTN|nr:helix-turn-helix domain-containing protein [Streptomyces fodineus]AOR29932.1 AraC family transcriptional regulator [Streptomyces fodineus]